MQKKKKKKLKKEKVEIEYEAEEVDLDEDDIEEEELFPGFKSPLAGKTLTGLDQVRAQTETVYEPFIFLSPTTCYIVWWKCETIALKFELSPQAVKVAMTTLAPTRDQIVTLSPQIPLAEITPLTGSFVVTLPIQIWPNSGERVVSEIFVGVYATINSGKTLNKEL